MCSCFHVNIVGCWVVVPQVDASDLGVFPPVMPGMLASFISVEQSVFFFFQSSHEGMRAIVALVLVGGTLAILAGGGDPSRISLPALELFDHSWVLT